MNTYPLKTTRLVNAFIVLASLVFAVNAQAQLNLCTSPCVAAQAVTPGVEASIQLQWRGEVEVIGDAATVTSKDGNFAVGNATNHTQLGNVAVPLRVTLSGPQRGGAATAFAINEQLVVPAQVSRRAAALGAVQLHYVRTFSVNGISQTASYAIALNQFAPNASRSLNSASDPSASSVGLNRVDLRFNTGKQVEVISAGTKLNAIATLNFDRAGMLDAVWEVATPETTVGQAVYRPLQNVRQALAAGRQVAIQSPALPTGNAGVYRVRLRITSPASDQNAVPVTLSYQVQQANTARAIDSAALITLASPAPNITLDADTEFSWTHTQGALAYQIEFFDSATPDTLRPITGLQLKPKQTQALLTASVFNRLLLGQTYYWRVVAFDSEGRVMAASELRPILTSP